MTRLLRTAVHRRLFPYYCALTLECFAFWFAIEKVFMRHIGFSDAEITLAVALVGFVVLLTEIPFGILADRTSRKGMTILSLGFFAAGTMTMGLATRPSQYILGMIGFALYGASGSGLDDSIIYDTVLEEEGSRDNYESYYGRAHAYASVALVISSFLGGFIAARYGSDKTYVLTMPFLITSIAAVMFFKEPKLHKTTEKTFVAHHLKATLQHVARPGTLRWILVAMLSIGVITEFLLEADQLWPLALGLPLIWYGPLNATLLSGYGLASPLAGLLKKSKVVTRILLCLGFATMVSLTIPRIGVVVFSQVVGLMIFSALLIVSNGKLHDQLDSRYRAGASSVVSSLTNLCFIPMVILFGQITTNKSVFLASIMLPPIALVGIYGFLKIQRNG